MRKRSPESGQPILLGKSHGLDYNLVQEPLSGYRAEVFRDNFINFDKQLLWTDPGPDLHLNRELPNFEGVTSLEIRIEGEKTDYNVLPTGVAADRLRRAREVMYRDSEWLEAHRRELTAQYGSGYIAVLQGAVLDFDAEKSGLLRRIRHKYGVISFYLGELGAEAPTEIDSIIYAVRCSGMDR